jgi:hypothetical protein
MMTFASNESSLGLSASHGYSVRARLGLLLIKLELYISLLIVILEAGLFMSMLFNTKLELREDMLKLTVGRLELINALSKTKIEEKKE